ncbi:MAG: hypothetical protein KKD28_06035 [Chloroflexi bacterium]|nr:hypothetical protein [Chloroflexota bacterium]
MSTHQSRKINVILVLFILLLSACNMPSDTAPTQQDTGLIHTIAAQTVEAQMTQAASGEQPPLPEQPTQTPDQQEPTQTLLPTNTPTAPPPPPPPPPPPTNTPLPTPTVIPCDHITWVKDVTIPDNTELVPGEAFTKTWRLKNTGSCTWTSGYSLMFESGDAMGAPASIQLTTSTVAPGQQIDVSVNLVAPDDPGTYQGFFNLRNPSGTVFGLANESKPFWVKIVVPEVSGVMFDFIARADEAAWGSGVTPIDFTGPGDTILSYPGSDSDAIGFVLIQDGAIMEDGGSSGKVLETHPKWETDGYIVGRFPEYKVGAGDYIKGRVGFLANSDGSCGVGNATFKIYYTKGNDQGTLTQLGSWNESCDGTMTSINVGLTTLKGQTVRFYLVVLAKSSASQDWAVWSSLGVMR